MNDVRVTAGPIVPEAGEAFQLGAFTLKFWTAQGWVRVRGVMEELDVDYGFYDVRSWSSEKLPATPRRPVKVAFKGKAGGWRKDKYGRPVVK